MQVKRGSTWQSSITHRDFYRIIYLWHVAALAGAAIFRIGRIDPLLVSSLFDKAVSRWISRIVHCVGDQRVARGTEAPFADMRTVRRRKIHIQLHRTGHRRLERTI